MSVEQSLIKQGYNYLTIYKEVIADTLTPLGTYLNLGNKKWTYFFESVEEGNRWGRYSIVGLTAKKVIKVFANNVHIYQDNNCIEKISVVNPLDWIKEFKSQYKVPKNKDLPDFYGGLVGYFGYETICYIEPRLANITKKRDELGLPDILLMLAEEIIVFDNLTDKAFLITHIDLHSQTVAQGKERLEQIYQQLQQTAAPTKSKGKVGSCVSGFGEQKYQAAVRKIKKYITSGDVMQVVPSQRLKCDFSLPAINLYRALRKINPSPYLYFLQLDEFAIIGSSPEILVRIEQDNNKTTATLRPLAGTRKRGATSAEDKLLAKELLADEKEIAEHLMLIDLGRNDLGRIAKIGSVQVTEKMAIEYYSHVMHIVSNVRSELKDDLCAIDVLKATFPAGTLSGAPKIRAMEIIDEVEPVKRGVYSGAVGYLSWQDGMDLAIAIRTAIVKNKQLYIQSGAGIVYDSNPKLEWEETMHKAQALIQAARLAKQY